tara:strand:+ start:13720 stop:14937 length:1218 start_codon:yes stop_codon:yes gene_type:complete
MKILVISDLHIGEVVRPKDLCPYPECAKLKEDENMVSSFINICKENILNSGDFDYLVIPGDITNLSNLIEYEFGENLLNKIISELAIPLNKVIFVPGNHDIDWSILNGIPEEEKLLRSIHKYNTLKDKRHLFSSLAGNELITDPYIKVWQFPELIFVGFNSSWHDDSQKNDHYGFISEEQLTKLRKVLEELPDKVPRIFIVHHHLIQLKNIVPEWIDLSAMQNGQDLFNLLSEYSVNFLIHGHRHVPHFTSLQTHNFNHINLLCAGSFTREIPSKIAGIVSNNFHIIQFDEFTEMQSKGKIFSYSYNNRNDWVESKSDKHQIDFINPFGNNHSIDSICIKVFELIKEKYNRERIIYYSTIIEHFEELIYLPLITQNILIDRIIKEFDFAGANSDEGEKIFINKKV